MRVTWLLSLLPIAALAGWWAGEPPRPTASTPVALPAVFPPACKAVSDMETAWGIQVLYARYRRDSAAVTVRYRVIDPVAARRFQAVAPQAQLTGNGLRLPVDHRAARPAVLGSVHDLTFPLPAPAKRSRQRMTLQAGGFVHRTMVR